MATKAKLFMHGRSQAVRLPGTKVRVTRMGHKVILEPLETPPFDVDAWWQALDALGAEDFLVNDVPRDNAVEPDDTIDFGDALPTPTRSFSP